MGMEVTQAAVGAGWVGWNVCGVLGRWLSAWQLKLWCGPTSTDSLRRSSLSPTFIPDRPVSLRADGCHAAD